MVERSRRTRFFPGYHAFPGGTLDPADGADEDARRRAAVREVKEETGVNLRAEDLVEAGRLLTPPFGPLRYDTSFFVADLPAGQAPQVDGEELVSGAWWRPADALRAFAEEAMPIPPPTLAYLHLLVAQRDARRAAESARATDGRPHHERFRIEMHPGVYALPLRTRTLPPATTTSCYLFDGDPIVVVDPGAEDPEELVALTYTLDRMAREGRSGLVVLTHHHQDHVGGAALVRERYRFPIAAHAATAQRLPDLKVDRILREGETLHLGAWASRPWLLEVLHTPGHAPGHIALRDLRWGAIVAGDLVSAVSTILVDPDEGDMGDYMASLGRCAQLASSVVLPAHGSVLPSDAFAHALEHRRMREAKALAALRGEPRSFDAMLPEVYDDTPKEAWGLAERNLLSILLHLERKGLARREGEAWRSA
jgi:glyoxylase-like metal-dependent hydrolase (beta-lactamase superfamily II)/8-oxo-dGTP pyrophosphatase MutT (NUDIX family)